MTDRGIAKYTSVRVFWILITVIPIIGLIWGIINPSDYITHQETSRIWSNQFGLLSPIIFLLIQALQVIITPLSHYTIGAIGGFLYGPLYGGVLNYIGRMLGHTMAFIIARKYGRPLISKYFGDRTINKYDAIFSGANEGKHCKPIQPLLLFLIYFLPLFPDDEISYLVGASKMRFSYFFLANLFGHFGGAFSLAYIGSGINPNDPWFWMLTISTLLGFPAIWFLWKKNSKIDTSNME